MEDIFKILYETVSEGREAVLVSIIASSGSTPRGEGAKMIVFDDGTIKGTVGGGRVEYLCIQKAAEAAKGRGPFSASYDLSVKDVADVGMICGGNVEVCFRLFTKEDIKLLEFILEKAEKNDNARLVTAVSENRVEIGTYDSENGLMFIDGISGETAQKHMNDKHSFKEGNVTIFMEPLSENGRVYIFGAGHVSRQLAPLLKKLDFKVTVLEEREVPEDAFDKDMDLVKCVFADIGKYVEITENDYVVVMTSGHSADFEVLEQTLRKRPSYAGVIGSRNKAAYTKQRLIEAGVDEDMVSSLHTPIGLAIKAATPAEIAVSVAAELIMHRAENR